MDTSQKYILMCEKAEEVQKEWQELTGDWFHDKNYPCAYGIWTSSLPIDTIVWLPRQDQLQEMIIKESGGSCITLIGIAHLMAENLNHYILNSFEQLWLAYLMHNRYQKRWDEKKEEWQEV